jgi:photosystem II stability/assembly factor-like uncharacterized protein
MRKLGSSIRWVGVVLLAVAGCHQGDPALIELPPTKISVVDRFYDVDALDAQHVVVVGYQGKILTMEDGQTWELRESGTDRALFSVDFVDAQHGWISGQDGLILATADGGRTWKRQESGTTLYLFSIDFIDASNGWAVGDRATTLHTTDGGRTWKLNKISKIEDQLSADEALLADDPVLYDVQFLDASTGWIVGEFGHLYGTKDGGRTWKPHQSTLLGDGLFNPLDLPTFFGVHFVDATNGIAAGLDGRVVRTRDAGETWKFEKFELERPIVDPLLEAYQFPDTTAWAVGVAGEVVRQAEASAPWRRISLGMEVVTWLRGVDFSDASNGWIVGGFGLILRTTDGGQTWLPSVG